MRSKVFIKPVDEDLTQSIRACFNEFGGVDSIVKENVFIKMNANTMVNSMTNPDVILSIIEVIKEASSKPKNVYVMDNCTMGTYTRLIFQYKKLSKRIKKAGAKPLYLDEHKSVPVELNGTVFKDPVPIPKILYENLLENRDETTYINVPRLKTHVFTGITISVKNQYGLLYDQEKLYKHHLINEKLIDLLRVFKPDFNIVDATSVVNYGPIALYDDWIIPMKLLISGIDAVAVDTVCSKLISIENVKHLDLAAKEGLGNNDFNTIEVVPSKNIIEDHKIQLEDEIKVPLPEHTKILRGNKGFCTTACNYLDSIFLLISRNTDVKPCIGLYGRGHDLNELDQLSGPFIVNGTCAVSELKDYFESRKRKEKVKVIYIDEHFDVAKMIHYTRKVMGVRLTYFKEIVQCSIPKTLILFIIAKLKGGNFITNI
jgi:uncharacterized protein (DUF362 family)